MIFNVVIVILILIYSFLVIKCCIKFYNYDNNYQSKSSNKSVDIIVCAKNESENISEFLQLINNQSKKDIHLIFIDDNSTDNTKDLVHSQLTSKMELHQNPSNGKKAALSYGVSLSKMPYILCTDADCRPTIDWAETMINYATEFNADIVMAPVVIEAQNPNSIFQKIWEVESFSLITITAGTCIANRPVMCNGGNIGYNSEFFKKSISDINSKYASGDDMFMMESASKQKRKFVYAKHISALIKTYGPQNWRQLFNQRARWVSKTAGYTDSYIIFFAIIIFATNLLAAFLPLLTMMSAVGIEIFVGFVVLKFLSDYFSAKISSNYYKMPQKFGHILLLEIVYPYYVIVSVLMYIVKGYKWK